MTKYRILERDQSELWEDRGTVEAAGTKAAVRKYVSANPSSGTFVAVPDNSFKPITVTVAPAVKVTVS